MSDSADRIDEVRRLPLEAWLPLLYCRTEEDLVPDFHFPTDAHRQEYLATIQFRRVEDVVLLLRQFLIPSGSLGQDDLTAMWLQAARQDEPQLFKRISQTQFCRRLMLNRSGNRDVLPWEGITWILDLLPNSPHQALQALDAYWSAHLNYMPDGRIFGIGDCQEVIRAKFIGLPGTHRDTIDLLHVEGPRTFECLVEQLYSAMGYETTLTLPSKDGGRDVLARKDSPGQKERLVVECKLKSDPVGVGLIRHLHGVVAHEKANKGVLVTSNRFTKGAREWAAVNPLELIPGDLLIPLMNEHLGPRWPTRIESLVRKANARCHKPSGSV